MADPIDVAASGEEALARIGEKRPDRCSMRKSDPGASRMRKNARWWSFSGCSVGDEYCWVRATIVVAGEEL